MKWFKRLGIDWISMIISLFRFYQKNSVKDNVDWAEWKRALHIWKLYLFQKQLKSDNGKELLSNDRDIYGKKKLKGLDTSE